MWLSEGVSGHALAKLDGPGEVSCGRRSGYNKASPPETALVPLALVTDASALEWLDLAVLAGLLVAYLLLAIILPGLVLRPFFWLATRTIYRVRVIGAENVPTTGPVLLLSNHVTFIDWLLIWHASPRQVRFVALAGWTRNPVFRWFLRVTDSILIDGQGGPKQLVRSLQQVTAALDAGEAVACSRKGHFRGRRRDALVPPRVRTRVLKAAKHPVPVVPVCPQPTLGQHLQLRRGRV